MTSCYLCPTCGGSGVRRIQQPTRHYVSGSLIMAIEGGTLHVPCECNIIVSYPLFPVPEAAPPPPPLPWPWSVPEPKVP